MQVNIFTNCEKNNYLRLSICLFSLCIMFFSCENRNTQNGHLLTSSQDTVSLYQTVLNDTAVLNRYNLEFGDLPLVLLITDNLKADYKLSFKDQAVTILPTSSVDTRHEAHQPGKPYGALTIGKLGSADTVNVFLWFESTGLTNEVKLVRSDGSGWVVVKRQFGRS